MDVSDCPRLRISGDDAVEFLHGQTTADVKSMEVGTSVEASIVTPQGRMIDLVLLVRMEAGMLLVCSSGLGHVVKDHLEKHIFMNDKVEIQDISSKTNLFRVMGPNSNDILYTLKLSSRVLGGAFGSHETVGFENKPVIVIKGTDLGYSGYTMIVDESISLPLWKNLTAFEVELMGLDAWNVSRILSGRPMIGKELTLDYTPYDAGLYHTVSLEKGCYVGQEALAKINTLDAGRWEMWGFILEKPCHEGDKIFVKVGTSDPQEVGVITSYVDTPSMQHRALGYLRRKVLGKDGMPSLWNGASILAGADLVPGKVVNVPYPTRKFST